jgi:hypothetical protein
MLTVAYFCIATELRFLSSDKNNCKTNGEFYHYKAVEFASLFLPVSCPIVKHYIYSYYKHYGNDLTIVPEGGTFNMKIELLRSEIEQDKDTLTFITTKKIGYTPNLNASIISVQSDTAGNNHNRKEFNLLRSRVITKGKIEGNKAPKFRLDFASLNKITNNNPNINTNTKNIIINNNTYANKKKDESSSLSGPSITNKENVHSNKTELNYNKDIKETNNLLLGLKPKPKEENNKVANFKLNFMNITKPSSYGVNNSSGVGVNVPININKEIYDNYIYAPSHKEYDLFQNNNLLAKRTRISEEKAPKFHLNFTNLNKNKSNDKDNNVNTKSKQKKKNSSSSNKINKKSETARVKTGKIQMNKNSPFYCGNNNTSKNMNNMNRTSTSKQRAETDRITISKMQLSKGTPFYCNTNRNNYTNSNTNSNNIKQRGVSGSKKKGNFTDRGVKSNMNKKV